MLRKSSRPDLRKVTKVCCSMKEGFVCLMSRNWMIWHFERLTSSLIPFIQEGIRLSHPEISILECEPFSSINLNFQKDFIWFKLKWFILFSWYLNEFKESKYLNGVQNFILYNSFNWVVKNFKQKVLFPKVYSKEFSSHHPSFRKDLKKFIKFLSNWIKIPAPIHFSSLCCRQGIYVPRMALEIIIYLIINFPLFLFIPLHLPKFYSSRVKVTPSCEAQYMYL
jgi:hypothetical protein